MGERLSDPRIHIGEGRRRGISRPPIPRCGCIMSLSAVGGRADFAFAHGNENSRRRRLDQGQICGTNIHTEEGNNMHGDDLAGSTHEDSDTTHAQDRLKII